MAKRVARIDWNDISLLLAVARDRQLRTAALRLGVDTSTVSRRLAAAEERLGTRLFLRKPDGYVPTQAGHMFLESAQTIEGQVLSIFNATRSASEEVQGPVRITSVDTLLGDWLVPRLPELLALHPKLEIRLLPEHKNLSFTHSESDLALRLARPEQDAALLMRRVGSFGIWVYGAPQFRGVTPAQWPELPWITYEDDLADLPQMRWLHAMAPKLRCHLRTSATAIITRACEAGLGLALLPAIAARDAKLVRLSDAPVHQREIWLLKHRATARIAKFRVVADWLAECIAQDEKLLLGL
ncbi:DNA-binding transcriptional regulator, LysR family [Solimonas aquatica]|uniref:DNA-binding transcriptional regulator, LysR family n=1 Tax=Solimonas aquatica TaxID=489703 RepID=A0A1H9JAT9_9GAMM|nr:LysR family transcriptional regulator [Solimonas aquatica]SEQ84141.1 DNA-binding transcriptional regulator, LysR family [Solimonas aquatica]